MRILRTSLVLGLLVVLSACAEMPTEMRYFPEETAAYGEKYWPPPPERARYRYGGELMGEQNFGPSEQSEPGVGEKVFRWIVGLGAGLARQPKVLIRPQTGMVDSSTGRIYVTDIGQKAVFVFDELQGRLSIWRDADAGEALMTPVGIAPGEAGEILVADAGLGRIVRLNVAGEPQGSFGSDVLGRPTGLARDPRTHQVYVADTQAHDIKVFDEAGSLLRRIGRRGSAIGEFNAPTHIALAGDRVYVSDTLNARVQVLSAEGQPLQAIGKRGLYLGNLTRPKGVTVDAEGNVYVVESYYDHLLVFNEAGQFLLPIGGTGSALGQFYLPAGTWSDGQGRIFVADMYNGRVVIFQYLGG